ncbi:unnamed protein product, partial [Ectocarpus sp. 13 AM-2016]
VVGGPRHEAPATVARLLRRGPRGWRCRLRGGRAWPLVRLPEQFLHHAGGVPLAPPHAPRVGRVCGRGGRAEGVRGGVPVTVAAAAAARKRRLRRRGRRRPRRRFDGRPHARAGSEHLRRQARRLLHRLLTLGSRHHVQGSRRRRRRHADV